MAGTAQPSRSMATTTPEAVTTTVFFDLDDTLYDHTYSVHAGLASLADPFPVFARQPLAHLADLYAAELEMQHGRVLAGQLTADEARLARFGTLARMLGASFEETDVVRVADAYRTAYLASRRAVPGALDLLQALRARAPRVRVGVITNNLVEEQLEKLHLLGMRPLIDVLVISEEAGVTKPDPAIFRLALARAGCEAPQAVMVGDSWTSDVLGARAVGLRAAWLNRTARVCPAPGACVTIASLQPPDQVIARILGSPGSFESAATSEGEAPGP